MEAAPQMPVSNHWDILAGKWNSIAILGVGNELNGDDAAGVLVARGLKSLVRERDERGVEIPSRLETPPGVEIPEDGSRLGEGDPRSFETQTSVPAVMILEAGAAPENFTGTLRRFRPELVVFVDAADLGAAPGSVAWLDWQESEGLSASTHTLPPTLLSKYLAGELGCRLVLVGIQPEHLQFDLPVSEAVMQAVNRICREMAAWLNG